jgi:mono/diheme cytochrome c family protein
VKVAHPATALGLLAALAAGGALAGPLAQEAQDYALQCQGCHGANGEGIAGRVPTLHGVGALAATPAGRAYLVQVPGVANASLPDARLAALLDWVLARWSAQAVAPYGGEEVRRLRAEPAADVAAARAALTGTR